MDCRAGKGSSGWPCGSARRRMVFPMPGADRKYLRYVRRAQAPHRTLRPKVRHRRSLCPPSYFSPTASKSVAGSRSWPRVTSRLRCPFTCWPRHETGVSTDRENNRAKTSEEYSTEDCRRQCGPGAASDNIHACPLEQAEDREIGCQQRQKNLSVAQPDDSDEQNAPQQRPQPKSVGQPSLAQSRSHRRTKRQLLGRVKRQRQEQNTREAQPPRRRHPCFGQRQIEPRIDQKRNDHGGEGSAEQVFPVEVPKCRYLLIVRRQQADSGDEQKARQVVAFEQVHEPERIPGAQQKNRRKREADKLQDRHN